MFYTSVLTIFKSRNFEQNVTRLRASVIINDHFWKTSFVEPYLREYLTLLNMLAKPLQNVNTQFSKLRTESCYGIFSSWITFSACGLTLPCPSHQREWRTWWEAWPRCIFMVDWKKPESTCPCGEGEDCSVQAMTIYSLCAHGWPLVDSQFHSWHLRTTHSAIKKRKDWKGWLALTDIWSSSKFFAQ